MAKILIENFIRQLNELQNGSRWFDQSFRDKLENVSDEEAFKIPNPSVHSVAEHVSHMLEWRKECILRYQGGKTELMGSPDDWKHNETLIAIGWAGLKDGLYASTDDLINLIRDHEDAYLETPFRDTEYNYKYLLEGIVHHDVYHLGQIGVTIKLLRVK
ncbi:MAG: DinB family protein [Chitinophagaceae bacterium]